MRVAPIALHAHPSTLLSGPLNIIWPCAHLRVLPASPLTPAPSWCHSLQTNQLDDSAKQQLQEAAGGRITFVF